MDPEVSTRARSALGHAEYAPLLITGDGLAGHPDGARYDRLIATCAVTELPYTWVEQTRPGGIILATASGWLHSSELARLTVGEDGTARGPLLDGHVSFMIARPQLPPPLGLLPDIDDGEERTTLLYADALDDWSTRFVAQLAAPHEQRLTLDPDGRMEHLLIDVAAGAWAAVVQDGETGTVRRGGPTRLWDDVEETITRWRGDGAPGLDQFEVTVTPEGQTVAWSRV
ncbi:hypothetical protein AQJ23_16795 [Streptomyces antibioticus]|nr:hypothetical protein AQJ23_16795 [Streptomyces antibioticus]